MKINLEIVCGPIAGIHSATIQGDDKFLDSLLSEAPLKKQFCGASLLIAARPERPAEAEYLIWATWFGPQERLFEDFLPLRLWKRDLEPEGFRSMLVLARAQGRWDILPVKGPGLPALLGERDPSGIPDGRVLMVADDPEARLEPAADVLARGLQTFFASIGERADNTLLPERSILIRSGRKTFDLSTESAMRVFFIVRASGNPQKKAQTPQVLLPKDFNPYINLKGSLIWGAWRGKGDSGNRFVTTTSSAIQGMRCQLGIRYRGNPLTLAPLAEALVPFVNEKLHPGMPPVTAQNLIADPAMNRMLSRALRTMESTVARNAEILKTLDTPYRLLHWRELEGVPTLAEAGRFPEPILLPGDNHSQPYANRLPGGFVSFSSLLTRQNDLALVARYSRSLASKGTMRGFHTISKVFQLDAPVSTARRLRRKRLAQTRIPRDRSLFIPFVPEDVEEPSTGEGTRQEAGVEQRSRVVDRIFAAACGHQRGHERELVAVYQTDRPSRLLMALLPEVAGWAGMPWPLPEEMQMHPQGCPRLRFRLETRVSREALRAWHTLATMEKLDVSWLRSAASVLQRTLRALLGIAVLKNEEEAASPRDSCILLVHRLARAYIAPRSGEIVADPAENSVVRRTIRGAAYSLRRKSSVWQSLLQKTRVPWARRTAAVFAEIQMDVCLERLEDIRRLLFAEAAMCHQLFRIAHAASRRVTSVRNLQPIKASESDKLARGVTRAAHRLWRGADTAALADVLLLAASGALANARDGSRVWPKIRLGLQPLNEEGEALGPMMCLDSAGVHEDPEEDTLSDQEGEVAGLTRAA